MGSLAAGFLLLPALGPKGGILALASLSAVIGATVHVARRKSRAKEKGVALIVRLPLASGLLSGRFTRETTFAEDDHRNYNRDGQCFNAGETFAGLPFEKGVELTEKLQAIVGHDEIPLSEIAMRWILDFDEISVVEK